MQGITSVQWGIHQYCGGYSVRWGIPSVQWWDNISTVGDNISTVEVAQYSGDKDLEYYEFSKDLEIFSRAYFASKSDWPHHRTQLLTTADMVKDLGYKNFKYFVKFFGNCGRICEQFMIQHQSRSAAILRGIQHLLRMNSNLVGIQSE